MQLHTSAMLLAAAALLGAAAGWALHAQRTRPDPGSEARLDTTRQDIARFDSTEVDRAASDRTARRRLAAGDTLLRAALTTAATAGQVADSLRQVLDTAALEREALRALAQAADDARRREADSLRSALALVTEQRDVALARWAAADSAAAAARQLLHDALRRLEATTAQTRARPLWRRVLHDGGCATSGFAAAKRNAAGVLLGGVSCLLL